MAAPRVKPSPEELLVRRVLNDKLEAARAELRESAAVVADALKRAESAERVAGDLGVSVAGLESRLAEAVAARKGDSAVSETVIASLRSEVAAMASDKERADQAEAALSAQGEKHAAEVAELREQLKDLQVKQYEFRQAVERLL